MATHLKSALKRIKRLVWVPSWASNITLLERSKRMCKTFPYSQMFRVMKTPACCFSKGVLFKAPQAFKGKLHKQLFSWPKRTLRYANHEESLDAH